MKKFISTILVICLIAVSVSFAFANTLRVSANTDLSFDGGLVHCKCEVFQPNSLIDMTMRLYRNGRLIRTWSETDNNIVSIDATYSSAVSGSTYRLDFTCYANGSAVGIPSITKVCP